VRWFGIHTQGKNLEELRDMVREAVDAISTKPGSAQSHPAPFVRDEVLAR